jgi:cytochrome P450
VLQSNIPPQEKSPQRLADEAQGVVGAGVVSTAWALSVGCYYILSNPDICQKLRDELVAAIPDPSKPLAWAQLEKIPYLMGCVEESIRLGGGSSMRLQRVAPNDVITYKDWKIPPKTPVSQTILDIVHNESVFPDSYKFIPERWIPATPGEKVNISQYAFSKGTRICLGMKYATDFSFPPFPLPSFRCQYGQPPKNLQTC